MVLYVSIILKSKNALECHLLFIVIIFPLKCKGIQDLQKAMLVFNQGDEAVIPCPPLPLHRQALQMFCLLLQIPFASDSSRLSSKTLQLLPMTLQNRITKEIIFSLKHEGGQELHHFLIN